MSAVRATGTSAVIKRRLSGVVFLLVIAGLVGLTIALYQKAFTPVVEVTLQADRAGNQLSAPADVKLRGLIVGEVREVASTGDGARLELALDPDQVELIPANVEARLLPKTLFGEKFVDLVIPEQASRDTLAAGAVIPQDRSQTAVETEQAVNDLLPLLQALKPQQLSMTLNAVSSALRGRGDRIGENLELVDAYLKEFNPEIPALGENFSGVADFADTLNAATPDILRLLEDLSFVNRSLVDQEDELSTFLDATAGFADETDSFLRENERRFVTLAADSLPPLELFAKYSPEFPCLAEGLAVSDKTIGDAFGGLQPGLHITLEITEDNDGYAPNADEPEYKDDRGPVCYGLERLPEGAPERPAPDINFQDGYRDELGPDTTEPASTGGMPASAPADPARALASAGSDRLAMGAVMGPLMGASADEVPDLAYLLFGPVARGTTVGLASGAPTGGSS